MLAAAFAAAATAILLLLPAAALAAGTKVVAYRGYELTVPSTWPVFRLDSQPQTCVRFNRHAVYLGEPSTQQLCPPAAAGRTEAILIVPAGAGSRSNASSADGLGAGAEARLTDRRLGLAVTATWGRNPGLIRRALRVASLAPYERAANRAPSPARTALAGGIGSERAELVSPAGGPASPGAVFSGLGFDACSAPTATALTAWAASSPYGAIGVYIGGANAACAQPNLTAAWVSSTTAAGWHLLPVYVGLQAPGNACGCAAISPASAAAQGSAAAVNAVAEAQALGIGAGNPIYFDMEAYTRGASVSTAVLAFLGAWTAQLHASGYLSGVYSSDDSGIADLVAQVGTGYTEPDEIWNAAWNRVQTTADSVIPATDWVNNERVHQYEGATEQTFGGVKIDVDGDALDAATAAAGTGGPVVVAPATTSLASGGVAVPVATTALAPPEASSSPAITGAALLGQTLTEAHAAWSGDPSAYAVQWEDCVFGGACTPIAGATAPSYTVQTDDVGYAIRVVETASNAGGPGTPASSVATGKVARTPRSGYWLMSAQGNVLASAGAGWFGSALGARVSSITGIAPTPRRLGYWLVNKAGRVFSYGNAGKIPAGRYGWPIRGIVASSHGAWLYTATGNVFNVGGAKWYGSLHHAHTGKVVGMASTRTGRGYWLVTSTGQIFAFGDAQRLAAVQAPAPIRGIVSVPGGGVLLYTSSGDVIASGGALLWGSPLASSVTGIEVTGMAPTADGLGYWVVDSAGHVFAYGDAPSFPVGGHTHLIAGITS
jgi:hypothetical protein